MVLEIHFPGRGIGHQAYWGNLDIIKAIGKRFISVNLHMNNYACRFMGGKYPPFYKAFAIEVSLVNRKLIKTNSLNRSYALHSKNKPNAPKKDCQM